MKGVICLKSKEIRKELIDHDISQKELAEQMGVLPSSLNRTLSRPEVPVKTALKIIDAIERIEVTA